MDNLIGVMGVDPGGTTGIAWGVFDKEAKTVEEAIKGVYVPGWGSESGSARAQIVAIGKRWRRFYHDCVFRLGISPYSVHQVVEDFSLTTHREVSARAGKDPLISARIGWGLWGYRTGQLHEWERHELGPAGPILLHFQMPAQAKSFATDARLKTYGVHKSGKPHQNDAWRHIALYLSTTMKQQASRPRARARRTR